jgi:hypothetical protein
MVKHRPLANRVALFILIVASSSASPKASGGWGVERHESDLKIWKEFVSLLRSGGFPPDRIEPLAESLREPLMGFLKQMRLSAHWPEWEVMPEVQESGGKINFIIALSFGEGLPCPYCFTFLDKNGRWMFHHMEAIFIRLDKTQPPPTALFPDTTEFQKAWDREENYWSKIIQWYGILVPQKGKEFFFDLMRDGNGYFVWAKSRAPFLPPHRAFIVFLCWEQANLREQNIAGEQVLLEKLTDEDAVVRLIPFYFQLYHQAAHLKPQIGMDAYQELFETIWQDRARAAGWTLRIDYRDIDGGVECLFTFHRAPDR